MKTMKARVVALLPKLEAGYVERLEVLRRLVEVRLETKEIRDGALFMAIESLKAFDLHAHTSPVRCACGHDDSDHPNGICLADVGGPIGSCTCDQFIEDVR